MIEPATEIPPTIVPPAPLLIDSDAKTIGRQALPIRMALLIVYGTMLSFMLMRIVIGWRYLQKLVGSALPLADDVWSSALSRAISLTNVNKVSLLESDGIGSPVATGWWRPKVIIPSSLLTIGDDQRAAILLHELAHIARGDVLGLLLLRIVQAVYWFNPLVWWLSKDLDQAREQACDAWCVHW